MDFDGLDDIFEVIFKIILANPLVGIIILVVVVTSLLFACGNCWVNTDEALACIQQIDEKVTKVVSLKTNLVSDTAITAVDKNGTKRKFLLNTNILRQAQCAISPTN